MTSLYDGLTAMGVPADSNSLRTFGPAIVLRRDAPAQDGIADGITVPVRFIRSNAGGDWLRGNGTLLEFAESLGIAPQFSSGICGACTTHILSGAVDYLEEPVGSREAGEVLLCCSEPRSGAKVVLDL
jgi:uncharacterized protein